MENKSHAFAAGAFVVLVVALVTAMAVWMARDNTIKRVYEISSQQGVTGLQSQAGVRYKGVAVGRVTAIELDPAVRGNVLIRIAVSEGAPITQSTFATLGFQGVTGLAFIQLDDSGESTQPVVAQGDQAPRIPMRMGIMSRLTDQGANLLTQLEQASLRVNALLAPENQKTAMTALANLGQAAASIHQLSQQAQLVLGPASGPGSLNLPQLASDASATLKTLQSATERVGPSVDAVRVSADEFKRMSARMNEAGGTLDKIAQGADALAATGKSLNAALLPRLNRTADDTARAVRQVGRAVDAVNDNPQSLLLGRGAAQPGPGESGFVPPAARQGE